MSSASLNAARRARELEALAAGEVVDLLVIGGGITGAGVALDAASRGLSVALVERHDLAHGTSRWSSKLAHGGLRYLAHGEFGIAFESARERGILLERTAPHLVRPMPMLVPFAEEGRRRDALFFRAGVEVGDVLRRAAGTSRRTLPRPRRVSAVEAQRLVPALRGSGLRDALLYWDGQLEDDARLVIAVARTAASYGARILTYCGAEQADGTGARLRDARTGETFDLRARAVISATGVWADTLSSGVRLRPSKGAHLVLRAERLGNPRAAFTVVLPDGSYVFAVPHPDGIVHVGLTDDPVDRVDDVPAATAADEEFLLTGLSRALQVPLTAADVVGRFAGLRPLLGAGATTAKTADLSRRHAVLRDPDGLLTVVGGKLTTYRRMAQDAVDRVTDAPCRTARLPLVGAAPRATLPSLPAPARLVRRYGTEALAVAELGAADPSLLQPVAPGLPVLGVELLFGLRHEGALTAEDLLDRRTRLGLVPADAALAAPLAEALTAAALTG